MVSRRTCFTVVALVAVLAGVMRGAAAAQPATRNFTFEAQKNDYAPAPGGQNYSACWSYIHGDGREYAVIGVNGITPSTGGSAIYNVTDPAAPYLVGFIPGPQSIWREFKSYRDWIYVVSEGSGPGFGVQIIRMTNPEAPVLAATYTTNFTRSHTVAVDTTRGILICNGTTGPSGGAGMRILALNNPGIGATPETPVEIAWWPGGSVPILTAYYVHDSVPVGNRLYASSIYPGIQRVLDFTNPAAPTEIVSWTYPGGFTHNAWPDATGNWLYVTDETKGEPLKIFDISNLASPTLGNAITSNPGAIVHNAHVKGDVLFLANYTEGIRALDLSDPRHPAEFAWADSYTGPSGGFAGVWEVGPFFPSGTVIASDRNSGLYVYRLVHDYGIIRAKVMDAGTELPAAGVPVYLTTQGDSLTTPADGIVQFAPSPGVHTVLAHSFGWEDATATRTVSVGSRDTVVLTIVPRPTVSFTGIVRSAAGGAPLDGGEVSLAYTPLHDHTGPNGQYAMTVPDDLYQLEVRRAGYVPLVFERRIGPLFPGSDYSLPPAAAWHDMENGTGWTVGAAGDLAVAGVWTRVAPLGTGTRPPTLGAQPAPVGDAGARRSSGATRGLLPARETRPDGRLGPLDSQHEEEVLATVNAAPYMDHSPAPGTFCWVTGQGTDSTNVDNGDVDGGKTSLTTPAYDLTGLADPTIGYWRWFCSFVPTGTSSGHNGPDDSDYLAVLISNDNGANWTVVDTTRGLENHWEEQAVHVAEYLTPTAQVKLRFVAADMGALSFVEAAIDDLTLYDYDVANGPVDVPPRAGGRRLAFRAPWPNPASGAVRFVLEVPAGAEIAVDVLDLAGRRVRSLHRGVTAAGPLALAWDGRDAGGREAPAGLYFARATMGTERALARFVRVR